MCLIAFSYKQHPRYDLIFAANRDEFYERPTREARFWDDHPGVLAGKDLKAGGTWMGINRTGKFSALTNYRDLRMRKEDPPSRGHLVLQFLILADGSEEYLQKVDQTAGEYNGFNLLAGTVESLMYYSNKSRKIISLEQGLYGLSNHLLDTPWPKVEEAKQELSELIQQDEIEEQALFDILKNDTPAPDSALPDTGIPREVERAVSSIFIKTENYGTRCSTILFIDKEGLVTFEERRFKNGTLEEIEKNRYGFVIEQG